MGRLPPGRPIPFSRSRSRWANGCPAICGQACRPLFRGPVHRADDHLPVAAADAGQPDRRLYRPDPGAGQRRAHRRRHRAAARQSRAALRAEGRPVQPVCELSGAGGAALRFRAELHLLPAAGQPDDLQRAALDAGAAADRDPGGLAAGQHGRTGGGVFPHQEGGDHSRSGGHPALPDPLLHPRDQRDPAARLYLPDLPAVADLPCRADDAAEIRHGDLQLAAAGADAGARRVRLEHSFDEGASGGDHRGALCHLCAAEGRLELDPHGALRVP